MNWEQAITRAFDSTAQHFLYFMFGWIASTAMWLMLVLGLAIGFFYRKKSVLADAPKKEASAKHSE